MVNFTIGSGEVEPEAAKELRAIARAIGDFLDDKAGKGKWGFIVMMFPFGDTSGRCNYMSNARREDIVILLKEQLRYFEGQADNLKGTG